MTTYPSHKSIRGSPELLIIVVFTLINIAGKSYGLKIDMHVPNIADPRMDLDLDCRFDMEGDDLYSVKWYKDEQEFFRYIPKQQQPMGSFHLPGVNLVEGAHGADCGPNRCSVRLTKLTRIHSGGAYRCEVSTEAPEFRVAFETHNVTVAALPQKEPSIVGVLPAYAPGEVVKANCTTPPADPAPDIAWFINGLQAPLDSVGDIQNSVPDRDGLVSRTLSLRFAAERSHFLSATMELRCVATVPAVPTPPLAASVTVDLRPSPLLNNQKLHWPNAASYQPDNRNILFLSVAFLALFRLRLLQ